MIMGSTGAVLEGGKLLRLQQSRDGLDLVAGEFRQASADRSAEIE
jgi:hypothetical protein